MKFQELAEYFERLEKTASRLTITEELSKLFKESSPQEIGELCYLLEGRVGPLFEAIEFGVADKFIIRAIAMAFEVDSAQVIETFRKEGDLGSAAQHIKNQLSKIPLMGVNKYRDQKLNIIDVFTVLKEIALTGGEGSQEKKITQISELLRNLDPLSVRYVVRIPLGKMRLGFSDMTILDALSWMMTGDKSLRIKLEPAYNVRPDIGVLARKLKAEGIDGIRKIKAVVGAPILSSLCQRLPTAKEMVEKMGTVFVEPKYDGVRVQIHYRKRETLRQSSGQDRNKKIEVKTFSRNLENTSEMFPELEEMGKYLNADEVIFDSEAVGVDPKTGKILPFQETTTRKRKHGIAEAVTSVPLRFYVFDILYKDGEQLLTMPLEKRREILEKTIKPNPLLELSPYIITAKPDVIRSYHLEQRNKGLEGVVVKKADGYYESGRRSYNWVKFKEEEGTKGKLKDTVDTVVMGYYQGEGKRSDFGIGAFLVGVKHGETFETITKVGTGVSDEQWRELFKRFQKIKVTDQPKEYANVSKLLVPDVWLIPQIVVEIAGDDLTKSPNHGAKYAIRFPRLVKIREDKSPNEATTVEEVEAMYKNQG